MNIYYVYAYLRDSDNTPYYIGKGKNHRLSNKNHSVSIPKDKNKIIILAEQLTNEEACTLEQEMICRYGRKDLGTGILHNRTNGGEGAPGFKQSDNHIASRTTMASNEKRSKTMSGRRWTVEHRLAISNGNKGKSKSTTENMKSPKSESHRKNISKGKLGIKQQILTCPHCSKTGGITNMKRYHFNFCKLKTLS